MKAEELRTKTKDELEKLLLDLRREQMNARFQKSAGTLDNTAGIRTARRTIARIKTFLNAPQGEAAPKAQKAPAAAKPAKKTKTKAEAA
ncbi:MAG: 50S ribosomal protein L29 [Alphaproteobacteria bacterium]|nr:50S ribosomal protein L29 [Alphaproteobacteria bacterium]